MRPHRDLTGGRGNELDNGESFVIMFAVTLAVLFALGVSTVGGCDFCCCLLLPARLKFAHKKLRYIFVGAVLSYIVLHITGLVRCPEKENGRKNPPIWLRVLFHGGSGYVRGLLIG